MTLPPRWKSVSSPEGYNLRGTKSLPGVLRHVLRPGIRRFYLEASNISSTRAFLPSILDFPRDLLLTSFAGYSIFIYRLVDPSALLVRHFNLSSVRQYSIKRIVSVASIKTIDRLQNLERTNTVFVMFSFCIFYTFSFSILTAHLGNSKYFLL